jgi:rare lipoprotein A
VNLMTAMPGSVSSRSKQPVCLIILCAALVGLAGCASQPKPAPAERSAREGAAPGSGRYYLDDGPGERSIADLEKLPDAVPRSEPLHPRANRPYVVFGRQYLPMTQLEPMRERGIATWYGRRYHDRPTAIGERYDMYGMTAAHPRLPLPSFARVTNLRNGRTITVRVNDRGPFLHGRVIDLSYAAAAKLGFANIGSTEVEVELITDPYSRRFRAPACSGAGAVRRGGCLRRDVCAAVVQPDDRESGGSGAARFVHNDTSNRTDGFRVSRTDPTTPSDGDGGKASRYRPPQRGGGGACRSRVAGRADRCLLEPRQCGGGATWP